MGEAAVPSACSWPSVPRKARRHGERTRYSAQEPAAAARHPRARPLRAWVLDTMGRTMEHITVAGHPEPIPASEVAAKLLRQRLETVRQERGADAADTLEGLIGARLGALLEEGKPSIDVANMRAVVDYAEIPEEEDNASGLERALRGVKDKLAQRGGMR